MRRTPVPRSACPAHEISTIGEATAGSTGPTHCTYTDSPSGDTGSSTVATMAGFEDVQIGSPATVLGLPSTQRNATWRRVRWPTLRAKAIRNLREVSSSQPINHPGQSHRCLVRHDEKGSGRHK